MTLLPGLHLPTHVNDQPYRHLEQTAKPVDATAAEESSDSEASNSEDESNESSSEDDSSSSSDDEDTKASKVPSKVKGEALTLHAFPRIRLRI